MSYDNLEEMVDAWLVGEIDDDQFTQLHQSVAGSFASTAENSRVWIGRQVDNPTYVDTLYLSGQITAAQLERLEALIGDYE
ncbi:hypothetical protein [Nocardioides sp.]|jgi:hypothetical protein|uniref:hypothetical protein n=1 Tax=Nocardioides sp. TaxID=35761 RepID=UPI002B9FE3A3|nr:hypothetical protein [Nocardioides sp.]HVX54304.1 hypothetical protein [Nocardioides sp.]